MFECSSFLFHCLLSAGDFGSLRIEDIKNCGPSDFATGRCFRPKNVLTLGLPWSRNRRDLTNLKFHYVPLPKAYHHVAMAIDVIIYNLCQSHTSKEKWHLRHRHHGIQKWTYYWNGKTKHRFFSEHHVQALSLHPLGSPGAKCCQYLPVNSMI